MINNDAPQHESTAGVCDKGADEWSSLVEQHVGHLHGGGELPQQCNQLGSGDTWIDGAKNVIAKKSGVYVKQAATGYYTATTPSTPQPPPHQLSLGGGGEEGHSPQTMDLMENHVDRHYAMPSTISPAYCEGVWAEEERGCTKDQQDESLQLKWSESTKELENCVGSDLCHVITCLDAQSTLDTATTSFHPVGTMYERSSLTCGVDLLPQGVLDPTNSEQLQQLQQKKTRLPTAQCTITSPPMSSDSSSTPNMKIPTHMSRSWGASTSGRWSPSQGDSSAGVPGHMLLQQQQHVSVYQPHHVNSASTPRLPSEQFIASPHKVHDRTGLRCRSGSVISDMWLTPQTSDVGDELMPFLMERESRAIVLWNIGGLPSADLRSMCEAYGDIVYFEDGFKDIGKCVVFVAYYDLSSAVRANIGLQHDIAHFLDQKQDVGIIHHHSNFMIPLYCVGLCRNAAIYLQRLDSCDGSPHRSYISESEAASLCQEYGTLKSVFPGTGGTLVEFFDTREARAVLNAFVSGGPMHGAGGIIAVEALRSDSERKLGQQLLSLLDKWKVTADADAVHVSAAVVPPPINLSPRTATRTSRPIQTFDGNDFPLNDILLSKTPGWRDETTTGSRLLGQLLERSKERSNSLDCRKANFHASSAPRKTSISHVDCIEETPLMPLTRRTRTHSESIVHCVANPTTSHRYSSSAVEGKPRRLSTGVFCTKGGLNSASNGTPGSHSSSSRRFKRDTYSMAGGERGGGGEENYDLDVERIAAGRDKRTTIMIRNIPNKYTQIMLLSEIDVAFKQGYDFFYLPIDFKNRCNIGYAFINFMDPQRIIPFWNEFNGQRWHNFNSEKVCAMSYARIQGKASMIARFQNSSLMERGDEYRPLIFFTSGAEKGLPEPFPSKDKNDPRDMHRSNHSLRGSSNGTPNLKGGYY